MRLIDYTYFATGLTVIPVNDVDGDVGAAQIAYINQLIDKAQPEILREIMGDDLYDEFMTEIAKAVHDSKWDDLKAEIVDTDNLTSFLTYFVYFEHKRQSATVPTEHGEYFVQAQNMQRCIDYTKICSLWNEGARLANEFAEWLLDEKDTYSITSVNEIDTINEFGI